MAVGARSSGLWVEVDKRDLEDIFALLEAMEPKDRKKFMQKATREGAKFLKPKVIAATPLGPGHFGVHAKKRVSFGAAKREKPAAIVKYRIGYTHMILDGTSQHEIKPNKKKAIRFMVGGAPVFTSRVKHPGAKGNPVIDKVADQYGDEALDRVADYLLRAFGLTE